MSTPSTMRAVVVREHGGPERLLLVDVPVPRPGVGQVRVRVHAAPVNPADTQVRAGRMVAWDAAVPRDQTGLGIEFSGTIDDVGEIVRCFQVGDEVIGICERLDLPTGAYAEYIVVDQSEVVAAPPGLDLVSAATIPLNGLTAWQALDALGLRADQWLLVTGAAGGLGSYVLQLALQRRLRVIGSGSASDEDTIRDLGAEHFISRDASLGDAVREIVPAGVDAVIDCAHVRVAAMDAVRHGGRFASFLVNAPLARRAIRTHNIAYHTDTHQLNLLSALAGVRRLTPRVAKTLPLDHARNAHEALEARTVRGGRIVLVP